jgi:hypothetical protein
VGAEFDRSDKRMTVRRLSGWSRPDRLYGIGALILVIVAVARLVSTYSVFTQTYDEPIHIACGMEWLDRGTYRYWPENPPLPRIAVALGPYLKGIRSHSLAWTIDEGNAILNANGQYFSNLALARLGNLPFLAAACVVIFLWARRWFDAATGFWAVLLFVNLPPILGHAGLATTDMACAAGVSIALYLWIRWLEDPAWRRTTSLGLGLGFAVLCKFSSLLFLGGSFIVSLGFVALVPRSAVASGVTPLQWARRAAAAAGIALVVMWGGYRFHVRPISPLVGEHRSMQKWFPESPRLRSVGNAVLELPLPLLEVSDGLQKVYEHEKSGDMNYLFGRLRQDKGWWAFFPVALGLKTPVGFLLLALGGMAMVLWQSRRDRWQRGVTAIFPLAILLVCMTSNLNMGVRHALAVYPFAALLAGWAVARGLDAWPGRARAAGPLLLVCLSAGDTWMSHPDYLAYFNQLAGAHPERLLAESDLDWGQDLHRLGLRLKALGIKNVEIAYFGTARLEDAGLPPYRVLGPRDRASGYIAVSVRNLTIEYAWDGSYGWLKEMVPVEKVGKSILLFHVPEA